MKFIILLLVSLTVLSASETFMPDSSDVSLKQFNTEPARIVSAQKMGCTICQKVMNVAIGKIAKRGCGFIFKLEAVAICETAGFGPEDPLADICAGAIIGACSGIAKLISEKVTNPATLCTSVNICQ